MRAESGSSNFGPGPGVQTGVCIIVEPVHFARRSPGRRTFTLLRSEIDSR
jgi:hypothetical protein